MRILSQIVFQWLVMGTVFTMFYLFLSKSPTARGVLREFFWWPHRVWKGAKVVWRNAASADLDK